MLKLGIEFSLLFCFQENDRKRRPNDVTEACVIKMPKVNFVHNKKPQVIKKTIGCSIHIFVC